MNYFICSVGTGNGIPLVVTCDSSLSGATITCTDGTTTLTNTCPSTFPYEVTFNLPNTGTWTVSGGTFIDNVTVTESKGYLVTIPTGSTVTPTDDVQILLNCANIWDKSYTTISELLADTTSLLAVISDNNAVDYLVRSTTFASSVCANSTAMTYIGADNYCADTLLANSTWLNAICNSTYFESVLNVKVPTMTSYTAPSGTVVTHSNNTTYPAWQMFDGDDYTNGAQAASSITNTAAARTYYKFVNPVSVNKAYILTVMNCTGKIQYSDDGTTWNDASSNETIVAQTSKELDFTGSGYHLYWAFLSTSWAQASVRNIKTIQFYGRSS